MDVESSRRGICWPSRSTQYASPAVRGPSSVSQEWLARAWELSTGQNPGHPLFHIRPGPCERSGPHTGDVDLGEFAVLREIGDAKIDGAFAGIGETFFLPAGGWFCTISGMCSVARATFSGLSRRRLARVFKESLNEAVGIFRSKSVRLPRRYGSFCHRRR